MLLLVAVRSALRLTRRVLMLRPRAPRTPQVTSTRSARSVETLSSTSISRRRSSSVRLTSQLLRPSMAARSRFAPAELK
jgi:hypothetical protein